MTIAKKTLIRKDRNRMFVSATAVFMTLFLLTVMTSRISSLYQSQVPITDLDVTPVQGFKTVVGLKTFRHPDHTFTFTYPESWNVSLTKTNIRDRDYHLLLTYNLDTRPHRIEFLRGGRGAPVADSVRRDTVEYNGRAAYKNSYIKDGWPFKQVITFRDNAIISPYIAIDAELPKSNGAKYEKMIDEIVSSIRPTQ